MIPPNMGALTNDVIIFGKDDGGRGVGLKMTSPFYMIYEEKFRQFDF